MKQNIKISVDAVIFGYEAQELKVLLVKQKYGTNKSQWGLVGGLVNDNESLTQAIKREIKEDTNIKLNYLEQLYTFGDKLNRDIRGRVISVAYLAAVNTLNFKIKADTDAEEIAWFNIDDLPKLAYDHKEIITTAFNRLKSKIKHQSIGFDLLPEKFLFSELEQLYSTILGYAVDRRNFRKKMLLLGLVEPTEEYSSNLTGRPAQLFTFNRSLYEELIEDEYSSNFTFV